MQPWMDWRILARMSGSWFSREGAETAVDPRKASAAEPQPMTSKDQETADNADFRR
jgi:hypothetical protein